jgi:hypothetical protein
MKTDEINYSDIRSLRIKILIDAMLEFNQFGQLSPQTVNLLEKSRKFKRIKKQLISNFNAN